LLSFLALSFIVSVVIFRGEVASWVSFYFDCVANYRHEGLWLRNQQPTTRKFVTFLS